MGKLFKLKWYCNFCKRQCSDENGFKVHCSTFSHQSAVEKYNRDPSGNKSAASNDFLNGFCAVLQGFSARQKLKKGLGAFGDEWVDSNLVYQEYIKDRHHIHLSSTRWKSVAGFVRFLRQKSIAEIKKKKNLAVNTTQEYSEIKYIFGDLKESSESENGTEEEDEEDEETVEKEKDPTKRPKWFIKLIDKSPEAILAAKSKSTADKKISEEESLQVKQMAAVEKFASNSAMNTSVVPVILKPSKPAQLHVKVASIFEESSDSEKEIEYQKRKNNLTLEILANELKRDRRHSREEEDLDPMPISYFPSKSIEISLEEDENEIPWIRKGLLIRISNETIGNGNYFKLLAVIDQVIDDFGAQVTILKNGDQLLLDQDDCLPVSRVKDDEFDSQLSVIDPKIMSTALKTDRCVILSSGYKGKEGRVLSANLSEFKIEISAAGSSQIHRKQLNLIDGQFCIYWE